MNREKSSWCFEYRDRRAFMSRQKKVLQLQAEYGNL